MTESPVEREFSDADIERLIEQQRQTMRPVPELPGWLPVAMRLLPYTLLAATVINGLIGLIAILTPILVAVFGTAAGDPIYAAYAYICPQRPEHTFFLAGHPMAFEQRDLSMHLGFALAGLLYLRVGYLRRPLPHWAIVAGVAPLLIDVALSTVGVLPSSALSRTWTGAMASGAIVWWSYPRFDTMLAKAQRHVAAAKSKRSGTQPPPARFVSAGEPQPANERM